MVSGVLLAYRYLVARRTGAAARVSLLEATTRPLASWSAIAGGRRRPVPWSILEALEQSRLPFQQCAREADDVEATVKAVEPDLLTFVLEVREDHGVRGVYFR